MLPEFLTLQLVTPERQVVDETVSEVQLPGRGGYLGILPGHAPLLTELGIGELSYHKGQETYYATVFGGFAEVGPDRVIVLAEIAERAEEIDIDRASAARKRAEERLGKTGVLDMDWDRATLALRRALIRLQVADKGGGIGSANEERHAAP